MPSRWPTARDPPCLGESVRVGGNGKTPSKVPGCSEEIAAQGQEAPHEGENARVAGKAEAWHETVTKVTSSSGVAAALKRQLSAWIKHEKTGACTPCGSCGTSCKRLGARPPLKGRATRTSFYSAAPGLQGWRVSKSQERAH
jgi:hypothetical protein